MRITNTMMTNNTMRNVSKSKNNLYTTEQQMSTQKKITRPSDDPIVAIRALSLRTSLSEITQYLTKNIPDAQSWISITETSLDNMDAILSDIYKYCNQGSTDSFTLENRTAIAECIDQLKAALYAEGNTDYSGRYVFTGFRTDTPLTFQSTEDANVSYKIEQKFTGEDFTTTSYMKNSVDVNDVKTISSADTPESESVYRLRLAYENCSSTTQPTVSFGGTDMPVVSVTSEGMEELLSTGAMADDTAYYVYDKGEIAFSTDTYLDHKLDEDISITFQKDKFENGDIRPEHYFNCTDLTNDVPYTLSAEGESIEYTINFNQSLKVNTEASNVLSYNMARDIDDLTNSLETVGQIEDNIAKLKEMKASGLYDNDDAIDSMLVAAEKELDYAKSNMESLFAKGMTGMQKYQAIVSRELSDLGSRSVRLTLAKTRLTQQQTTFKDLKSSNEDVELEDIAIDFAAAETVYDAAIATASKTVRQSLLDYL